MSEKSSELKSLVPVDAASTVPAVGPATTDAARTFTATESTYLFEAVATIQVVPAPRTLITPRGLTVATVVSLDRYFLLRERDTSLPNRSLITTSRDVVSPISRVESRRLTEPDGNVARANTLAEMPSTGLAAGSSPEQAPNKPTVQLKSWDEYYAFPLRRGVRRPGRHEALPCEVPRSPVVLRPRFSPGLPLSLPPRAVYDPAAVDYLRYRCNYPLQTL